MIKTLLEWIKYWEENGKKGFEITEVCNQNNSIWFSATGISMSVITSSLVFESKYKMTKDEVSFSNYMEKFK